MQETGRAWRLDARDLSQYEFLNEAELAQLGQSAPIDLADAVRTGDDFVLAMGNCSQCEGPCHLWFMDDSESPADVCPYLIFFADFMQNEMQNERRAASGG